jgi:SlyX protein
VAPLRHTKVYTVYAATSSASVQRAENFVSKLVSNSAMEHSQPTDKHIDQRLTDLEIKASFAEDMVEQLNQIIIRQQKQIDQLVAEVLQLREQSEQAAAGGPRNLRDDLPPHF